MKEKVISYVSRHWKYLLFAPKAVRTKLFLHWTPKDNISFDTFHLDHLGPCQKAHLGYKCILLLTFNKFVKFFPIKTNEVIKHVQNYLIFIIGLLVQYPRDDQHLLQHLFMILWKKK